MPELEPRQPSDELIPARIVQCLKPPGAPDDAILERISGAFRCTKTGMVFPDRDGVPSLLTGVQDDATGITGKIKSFYERNPFPNYDGIQSFGDLVERGNSNPFGKSLLQTIGYNKLILECGCGTGQMSHYLSLNNNYVLGVDLSLASLTLAVDHKRRYQVPRSSFVQMNIFELGIKDATFDVVLSSGVLHHTKDAPRAFASIVKKAKPGGLVIVGLYNLYARVPTWIRSKLIGLLGPKIDYVVRNRIRDARKAAIWVQDQYYNPHETWHSIDEVLEWFRKHDVTYLNCYPPIIGSDVSKAAGLLGPTDPGSTLARVITQLLWIGSIAAEGALFVMVGRRKVS